MLKAVLPIFLHENQKDCLMKKLAILPHLVIIKLQSLYKAKFFSTDLLKQDKVTYNHGLIVNIYIVYKLDSIINNSSVTLENCLFGAVKLTKNADINKYKYSGYGTGFDSKGTFSHPRGGDGKNVVIFGADMSSSAHSNNKTRSILVLGKDFIQ